MLQISKTEQIKLSNTTTNKLFKVSIIGKGVLALFDIISGLLLYVIGPGLITNSIVVFVQGEFIENPNSKLVQFFLQSTNSISIDTTTFVIVYLLVHGSINAIFVIGLLREKQWAFHFALYAMSAFLIYQLYRLLLLFSLWLFVLTLFDLMVIFLVWYEYHYHYKQKYAK